jgi:hypothetical protein
MKHFTAFFVFLQPQKKVPEDTKSKRPTKKEEAKTILGARNKTFAFSHFQFTQKCKTTAAATAASRRRRDEFHITKWISSVSCLPDTFSHFFYFQFHLGRFNDENFFSKALMS